MEYIHHPATEEIMHPPKISPAYGTKTFYKAIVEPAKHIELYSTSPEESKEDVSIEDFVRNALRERIHGTLLTLQLRDAACGHLANVASGGWKSWTELWVERCGDVFPDGKENHLSHDYQGAPLDTPLPSPSAKTASELPVQRRNIIFWRRIIRLFTCCRKGNETQEPVVAKTLNDATERVNINESPKKNTFSPLPSLRRSASTIW